MFLAIKNGNYSKAIAFLDSEENVNLWKDKEGRTALINCAFIKDETKSVGLARALLQTGARVAERDNYGYNSLHYACMEQRVRLVNVLLSALDCHVNAKCPKDGNTALHYAAMTGNVDTTTQLLQQLKRYHLSLDLKNKSNKSALHLAVEYYHNDVARLLLDFGADDTIFRSTPISHGSESVINSKSSSSGNRSNSLESQNSSRRVSSLRQQRMRLKPKSAPSKSKQNSSAPHNMISCKLKPTVIRHEGFVDQTKLYRLKALRGSAMTHGSLPSTAMTSAEGTWRETMSMMWNKYAQQYSEAFRGPAIPQIIEESNDDDDEQSSIADDLVSLAASSTKDSSKRRHSSQAAFQRNSGRRGTVFQPPSKGLSKFELQKARRQSLYV